MFLERKKKTHVARNSVNKDETRKWRERGMRDNDRERLTKSDS